MRVTDAVIAVCTTTPPSSATTVAVIVASPGSARLKTALATPSPSVSCTDSVTAAAVNSSLNWTETAGTGTPASSRTVASMPTSRSMMTVVASGSSSMLAGSEGKTRGSSTVIVLTPNVAARQGGEPEPS